MNAKNKMNSTLKNFKTFMVRKFPWVLIYSTIVFIAGGYTGANMTKDVYNHVHIEASSLASDMLKTSK